MCIKTPNDPKRSVKIKSPHNTPQTHSITVECNLYYYLIIDMKCVRLYFQLKTLSEMLKTATHTQNNK